MLLELAIGDAYGAGFEYTHTPHVRQYNTLTRYIQHPRHHGTKPGMYTDDTQMSLAIAETVLACQTQGARWSASLLAENFVRAFHRDPREGYARNFFHFLQATKTGEDFLENIHPTSDKSGAAMRAAPLGIFSTPGTVIERCIVQAKLTHDTPDGIHAACAAALMSHYFLYDVGSKQELGRWLEGHVPGPWSVPWIGRVKSKGWMSVRAAITALQSHQRLRDLLRACVAFTGDVDTVAAIALGAASSSPEYEQDLPTFLIQGLEDGPFGRAYIQDLDRRLQELLPGSPLR